MASIGQRGSAGRTLACQVDESGKRAAFRTYLVRMNVVGYLMATVQSVLSTSTLPISDLFVLDSAGGTRGWLLSCAEEFYGRYSVPVH